MLMNDERQTTTLCNFKVSLFHSLQTHGLRLLYSIGELRSKSQE
jgi:hypothetical protein